MSCLLNYLGLFLSPAFCNLAHGFCTCFVRFIPKYFTFFGAILTHTIVPLIIYEKLNIQGFAKVGLQFFNYNSILPHPVVYGEIPHLFL